MNRPLEPLHLFGFDNSYGRLPDRFYTRLAPTAVAAPRLVRLNRQLARVLKLDPQWLASSEGVASLVGNRVPEDADPLAMAYAGHQFGAFVPQLGDGRAILLGEIVGSDGVRRDVQLKGAGRTPYSRNGDGRAALGPVLREYIVSEAMAALDIPTTRALAAIATGETVWRETPQPGAVLVRVAASHIRVGTFQFFAVRGDGDAVRQLADHSIARHYPEAASAPNPYLALLEGVVARQADLVARWMLVGFIHGVMNTDNTSIAGETIDYGPCAFLDNYHPGQVYSSIDAMGRYAYANQPRAARWNLARLAEALLPLLSHDKESALAQARGAVEGFTSKFAAAFGAGLQHKLGLEGEPEDLELAYDLLERMAANQADFTLTFRSLCDAAVDPGADAPLRALFTDPSAFDQWVVKWRRRLAAGSPEGCRALMRAANPRFIPRNHLVEEALAAAMAGDLVPFERLLDALSRPFDDRDEFASYGVGPRPEQVVYQTFCGT
jgi:uncharacterized protein YdiU (UPF0061 family)